GGAGGVQQEIRDERRQTLERLDTVQRRRMHEYHGAAAVEFVKKRIERLVAEIDSAAVCQQHDAIGIKLVECVGELVERPFEVGKAQRGEEAEAIGMAPDDFGGEFVHLARLVPRLGI